MTDGLLPVLPVPAGDLDSRHTGRAWHPMALVSKYLVLLLEAGDWLQHWQSPAVSGGNSPVALLAL